MSVNRYSGFKANRGVGKKKNSFHAHTIQNSFSFELHYFIWALAPKYNLVFQNKQTKKITCNWEEGLTWSAHFRVLAYTQVLARQATEWLPSDTKVLIAGINMCIPQKWDTKPFLHFKYSPSYIPKAYMCANNSVLAIKFNNRTV